MYVCFVHMYILVWYPFRSEDTPGTETASCCELYGVGAGNQPLQEQQVVLLTIEPSLLESPRIIFLIFF